jgi:GAF domain-containing protein
VVEIVEVDSLRELNRSLAAADSMHEFLGRIVEMVSSLVQLDSCFVYLLEENRWVLAASKPSNLEGSQGGAARAKSEDWVAETPRLVALSRNAMQDPYCRSFEGMFEGAFDAFLSVPILCRERPVGAINLLHRSPHTQTEREICLVESFAYLAGAKIEMLRLEKDVSELGEQLEARKIVERAKGILQKDLQIAEGEAYCLLRRESRQRRKPMKEIARAVVLAQDLRRADSPRVLRQTGRHLHSA